MNLRVLSAAGIACLLVSSLSLAQKQSDPKGEVVLGESSANLQLPTTESARRGAVPDPGSYRLRVVYVIPSNRSPQPQAEERLQQFVITMQRGFADRLELLGYAPKLLRYETESNGLTPKVNVVHVAERDTDLHGDFGARFSNVLDAMSRAGFPSFQAGEALLVVAEMQVQLPDGSFLESSTFAGGAAIYANFSGVGMVTADVLPKMAEARMTDDQEYAGQLIPEFGPYPLVQYLSFPSFEGPTVSSITSSGYGAAIHELGHGLGLAHDFRNDTNFNGNLMGNGLRGVRGALFPERYPQDDVRLSTGSALMLNFSRFFNSARGYTDQSPPEVHILTAGTAIPEGGLCKLGFTAADAHSGLAGAVLIRDGQVVADMALKGAQYSGSIAIADYNPGVAEDWQLLAIDRQGNTAQSFFGFTCAAGYNRAPLPFVHLSKTSIRVGEQVMFDAGGSFDPDGDSSGVMVEWDLNGDGRFDTSPSVSRSYRAKYARPGVYQVVARLTDGSGGSSLSMPIGIRVKWPTLPKLVRIDIAPDDRRNLIDVESKGEIGVALLSDRHFQAREVNIPSLRFGPGQAKALRYVVRDVNRDGTSDLVLGFKIAQTGIACGHRIAQLQAKTLSGKSIIGLDTIKAVGCSKK